MVFPVPLGNTSKATAAAADAVAETSNKSPKLLQKGSSGRDVIALQHRLVTAGYRINVDGDFGDKQTEPAVKSIQKAAGLPQTGIVDKATSAAIDARIAAASKGEVGLGS